MPTIVYGGKREAPNALSRFSVEFDDFPLKKARHETRHILNLLVSLFTSPFSSSYKPLDAF